jgi:hypothetical protein
MRRHTEQRLRGDVSVRTTPHLLRTYSAPETARCGVASQRGDTGFSVHSAPSAPRWRAQARARVHTRARARVAFRYGVVRRYGVRTGGTA